MSLSDELLADFEDEGMNTDGTEAKPMLDTIEEEMETANEPNNYASKTVKDVAKLYSSSKLQNVMSNISEFSKTDRRSVAGPVELDPEYQVIVEANQITVEIDEEIGTFALKIKMKQNMDVIM